MNRQVHGYNLNHISKPPVYTQRQRVWLWLSRRLDSLSEWCASRGHRGTESGYEEFQAVDWPPLTTFSTSIEFVDQFSHLPDEERTRLAADYLNRRDMDA